ncbi:MAG TPA: hypothetical protein VFZ25_08150, partial [Chloroflexota bacterium]|nr:hypothetical protein [Chloroflexota bacterium]
GLRVADLARVDLDGDGQTEVVALLPVGSETTGWIITRQGNAWKALLLNGGGLNWSRIGSVTPRPDRPGKAITLIPSENVQPPGTLVSLTNGQPQFFAPDGTPLQPASTAFPGQCSIAEALGP